MNPYEYLNKAQDAKKQNQQDRNNTQLPKNTTRQNPQIPTTNLQPAQNPSQKPAGVVNTAMGINNKAQKHAEVVEKIIKLLETNGPTLPIKVASETGQSMIFASAFLSELIGKKIVKISNLKIGNSPLYYLPGQEGDLTKFVQHLKGREREAYDLLAEQGILRDEEQEPAIRVALRSLKDFAQPLNTHIGGQTNTFWRHISYSEEEAKGEIRQIIEGESEKKKPALSEVQPRKLTYETNPPLREPKKEEGEQEAEIKSSLSQNPSKENREEMRGENPAVPGQATPEEVESRGTSEDTELLQIIKKNLGKINAEITEEIESKKKEALLKIKINTDLGETTYFVTCKDKKRISDTDLALAHQKAQGEKLPGLFITTGDLTKKAEEYWQNIKNLLKIKKVSL